MTSKKKVISDVPFTNISEEKDCVVKCADEKNVRTKNVGEKSLSTKWHDKCRADYESGSDRKNKSKKKPKKNYPHEVVRFVEGVRNLPEQECHASKKLLSDSKRKSPRYNTEVRFLEHKFIQCNIRVDEDVEVFLPEEIKPLLINVTFLLHELKLESDTKNQNLCNLISKITSLLMEISKRPIKKFGEGYDQVKPFDEVAQILISVLNEHNGPDDEKYENLVKEVKHLEEELKKKDSEVNYVKEQIREERARLMSDSTSLNDCLRNSILKNESLKMEIKQNKAQFRKYRKILAQKEQLKQKSLLELNNLRRKCAKLEQSVQQRSKPAFLRLSHTDADVLHGGSMTKYIESKITKDKKIKQKTIKPKASIAKEPQMERTSSNEKGSNTPCFLK